MRAVEYLHRRQSTWAELESLCRRLQRSPRSLSPEELVVFAKLYRATCADLALADAHQLPEPTVRYLHQLVARAHNLLYRSRFFRLREWLRELLFRLPRRLFHDPYLRAAAFLFYGLFLFSFVVGWARPGLAEALLGREEVDQLEQMYEEGFENSGSGRSLVGQGATRASLYISHNTSIGFRCFAAGLLMGVGGLFALTFNAVVLGIIFGYMNTTPMANNFNQFVTAHAPFELTAIVLSAAAGMRLGFALLVTRGKTRAASLREAGKEALPVMMLAALLFLGAAVIEGYVSPSPLPYAVKALVAIGSAMLLAFYFVMLGMAGNAERSEPERELSWQEIVQREDSPAPATR